MIEYLQSQRHKFLEKFGPHVTIAAPRPQIIVRDYTINSFKMFILARFREMIGDNINKFDLTDYPSQECNFGLNIHADAVGKAYKHTIVNCRLFTMQDKPYLESQKSDTSPIIIYLGPDQEAGPKLKEFIANELIPAVNELEGQEFKIHWQNKIHLNVRIEEGRIFFCADNAGRGAQTGLFFFRFFNVPLQTKRIRFVCYC